MARLPDIILIGSPKAGTTTLCDVLAQHPDIYMLPGKEAHFFNDKYDQGIDWYTSLFKDAPAGNMIAEGTPDYTEGARSKVTAERMAKHLPQAKLIYMVREPIKRLESHYVQALHNGLPTIPLHEAVKSWPQLVQTSQYFARLEDYLAHYPMSQIHILFYEDFITDPKAVVNDCLTFLGLPSKNDVEIRQLNSRDEKTQDSALLGSARRWSGFKALRSLLPQALVDQVKPFFRRPVDPAASLRWTPETRDFVEKSLSEDIPQFLEKAGRPSDFWAK
ncbi:MAG: sulfotransferase [Pseudomonadota bacterium]